MTHIYMYMCDFSGYKHNSRGISRGVTIWVTIILRKGWSGKPFFEMCCFHVTIARKVLGNTHIDYRTNTFQKGALLSWELCWMPSFTKIELSIWDNLYRPSVIPWAIIRCPNPSLCAKQTTHWKTLLYGRQKNRKTSATTNLTTIGGWATLRTPCLLGAPTNSVGGETKWWT